MNDDEMVDVSGLGARAINAMIKNGAHVFLCDTAGGIYAVVKVRTQAGWLQALTTHGDWNTVTPPSRVLKTRRNGASGDNNG